MSAVDLPGILSVLLIHIRPSVIVQTHHFVIQFLDYVVL